MPQSPRGGLPSSSLRSKRAELFKVRVAPWDNTSPIPFATLVGFETVLLGVSEVAAEVTPGWCEAEKWEVSFWRFCRRDMREDPLSQWFGVKGLGTMVDCAGSSFSIVHNSWSKVVCIRSRSRGASLGAFLLLWLEVLAQSKIGP